MGNVDKTSVTFTPENWNVYQDTTFIPVNDSVADTEGETKQFFIQLQNCQSTDPGYNNRAVTPNITVNYTDDDVAGFVIFFNNLIGGGTTNAGQQNWVLQPNTQYYRKAGTAPFTTLTPKAKEIIRKIGNALEAYPETTVRIGGHTDSVGSFSGNLSLSKRRAKAVPDELINRKGDLAQIGLQLLEIRNENLGTYSGAIPYTFGKTTDTGTLWMLEASIRYCRFTLDIGFLGSEFTRRYSSYVSDVLVSGFDRSAYSAKTHGFGFGELSTKFGQTSTEIYFMPGFSLHFDEEGFY
jgi:hypothetical protein